MEITTNKEKTIADESKDTELNTVSITYPYEQLLSALYFAWDAAERGQLQMFLRGDTAKQIKDDKDLSGSCLTLGVRKQEWESGQGSIFRTFAEHEIGKPTKEDKKEVVYYCKDVPIIIKIYEDNPTLSSFDTVFYRYETFNLPNPFAEFVEKYD